MGDSFNQVLFSTINFTIFFVLLFLLLRKPLISFLKKRKDDYVSESEKCMKMKYDAEAEFDQIRSKLSRIEGDGRSYIAEVAKEAEILEQEMLQNTRDLAELIKKDSGRLVSAELLKGEQELKKAFVLNIIKSVEKDLSGRMAPADMSMYVRECSDKVKKGEVSA